MRIKAYASKETIKRLITQYEGFGTPLYHSKIEEHSEFLVFEQYSIINSNRMSISIVLEGKDEYTDVHFITSGSAQGFIFRFDWGSENRRKNRLITLLNNNHIRYEVTA